MKTRLSLALAVLATVLIAGLAPAATATEKEQHCVLQVVDQKESGEMVTQSRGCYATFAQAMERSGVVGAETLATGTLSSKRLQSFNATVLAGDFTIGVHYDGFNWTGSSTSVVGSSCSGGWLNTSSFWDNKISSTLNGCYRIRHRDGSNLTGDLEDIVSPGGNLSLLNNRTESIQYLS